MTTETDPVTSPGTGRRDGGARIELLHIADCPNWEETLRLLRSALDATGHRAVPIGVQLLDSQEAAGAWAFAGSPTILVDGVDLFPSAGRTRSLACRVYATPRGFSGHPTRAQLEEAIVSRMIAGCSSTGVASPRSAR
ncbi:thioredoxin family protein [Agromyces mariniharenae]|uniref:Thioredoxin family protein n=1 Tax=Agromyces mariniharenae TaxID=2604423 RepID=A0A5S4V820_9MICO|nr:thioredoxin family protein [Agromyces mariniharenae]